jgi:hypothetical protein
VRAGEALSPVRRIRLATNCIADRRICFRTHGGTVIAALRGYSDSILDFSPADVRTLLERHRTIMGGGWLIFDRHVDGRAKTGRAAIGTLFGEPSAWSRSPQGMRSQAFPGVVPQSLRDLIEQICSAMTFQTINGV